MLKDHCPQVRGLILDMDGVLWQDSRANGDLPQLFADISAMGLSFCFATNNATRSREEVLEKLAGFGVVAQLDQIFTSATASLKYLSKRFAPNSRIYVVGTDSLRQEVRAKGFEIVTDEYPSGADVVLVALDPQITYQKLSNASTLIRSGAQFIATNTDRTFPTPNGLIPGAGTLVAAIAAASDQEPYVIGKPQTPLFEQAMDFLGTKPNETLCVGDRLETDILGGQNAGCLTALVLSGVSTLEQAQSWNPQPTIIARDLTHLIYD